MAIYYQLSDVGKCHATRRISDNLTAHRITLPSLRDCRARRSLFLVRHLDVRKVAGGPRRCQFLLMPTSWLHRRKIVAFAVIIYFMAFLSSFDALRCLLSAALLSGPFTFHFINLPQSDNHNVLRYFIFSTCI